VLAQPGHHRFDVGDVLARLAEAAQVRWSLAVRRRVDDRHQEIVLREQLARANQEVPAAPLPLAVVGDLKPAVASGEQDHGRPRLRRSE